MPLVLSTVRCPPGMSPQNREVVRGVISIGRAGECDWMLSDPERILSKRHCLLSWHDESWLVTDTSSNGTLLNGQALDPGMPRQLRSGDRLALGAYEIEVQLDVGGWEAAEPATITARRIRLDPHSWPLSGNQSARGDDALTAILDRVGPPSNADSPGAEPPDIDLPGADDRTAEAFAAITGPARVTQAGPARSPGTASGDGLAEAAEDFRAFAGGASIVRSPRLDSRTALGQLGGAFRAMVAGVRRMAAARHDPGRVRHREEDNP